MFILVLSFACFSRSMTATHMKSSITQIERHFDISTTAVGLIDGSFEMGTFCRSIHPLVQVKPPDLLSCLLGDRQPAVPGRDQPFRGAAAPTQSHFRGMFHHGLGGPPHRPDPLLHGTVNISQHAIFTNLWTPKRFLNSIFFLATGTSTAHWARLSRITPWTAPLVWKKMCLK